MKKRLIALLAVLMLAITIFAGCGIIIKNEERDLNQIVLSVGYDESHEDYVRKTDITKRELKLNISAVSAEYSQYLSQSQIVELVVKQLQEREIMIQQAILYFAKGDKSKRNLDACLTGNEINEIMWNTYEQEKATLKRLEIEIAKEKKLIVEKTEDEKEEIEIPENRVYQLAVSGEEIVKIYDRFEKPQADIDYENNTPIYQDAIKRYARYITKNHSDATRESVFNEAVEGAKEDKVLQKYKEALSEEYLSTLKTDDSKYYEVIKARYDEEYQAQKNKYSNNNATFVTDLTAYKGESLMLYNPIPNGGSNATRPYFYVKNLLIGFDESLTASLKTLRETGIGEKAVLEIRKKLLNTLEFKDLRNLYEYTADANQWLYNATSSKYEEVGYKKELIEYPSYLGSVPKQWNATKNKEDYLSTYVPSKVVASDSSTTAFETELKNELNTLKADAKYLSSEVYNHGKTDVENAFATLIHKYGTDPGMFNNAVDYLVAPKLEDNSYVKEFTEGSYAAYDAYKNESGSIAEKQLASIKVVATDFGWHVIMVSKVLDSESMETFAGTKNEFMQNVVKSGSFEQKIADIYESEFKDKKYEDIRLQMNEKFKDDKEFIRVYTDTYKDLLK